MGDDEPAEDEEQVHAQRTGRDQRAEHVDGGGDAVEAGEVEVEQHDPGRRDDPQPGQCPELSRARSNLSPERVVRGRAASSSSRSAQRGVVAYARRVTFELYPDARTAHGAWRRSCDERVTTSQQPGRTTRPAMTGGYQRSTWSTVSSGSRGAGRNVSPV